MTLRVNFTRAISRSAWLLYPTKLPRRPFAIEAVTGQELPHALQLERKQKDRLAAVSPKSY